MAVVGAYDFAEGLSMNLCCLASSNIVQNYMQLQRRSCGVGFRCHCGFVSTEDFLALGSRANASETTSMPSVLCDTGREAAGTNKAVRQARSCLSACCECFLF